MVIWKTSSPVTSYDVLEGGQRVNLIIVILNTLLQRQQLLLRVTANKTKRLSVKGQPTKCVCVCVCVCV